MKRDINSEDEREREEVRRKEEKNECCLESSCVFKSLEGEERVAPALTELRMAAGLPGKTEHIQLSGLAQEPGSECTFGGEGRGGHVSVKHANTFKHRPDEIVKQMLRHTMKMSFRFRFMLC